MLQTAVVFLFLGVAYYFSTESVYVKSHDNSVGIAMSYGLESRGLIPGWDW
jgi:hypothetical protein